MARQRGSYTKKPRKITARYRAWQSMRILRRFSIQDLVATAWISKVNAKKYVSLLQQCGYVRTAIANRNGCRGDHAVYRLTKNTGPKPPRMRGDGMFDPNTGEEFPNE